MYILPFSAKFFGTWYKANSGTHIQNTIQCTVYMSCNVVRNMNSGIQTRRDDTMNKPRRRIMVMSSLYENPWIAYENYRKGEGYSTPPPFYGRLLDRKTTWTAFPPIRIFFHGWHPTPSNHPWCLALFALSLPYLIWYFLTVLQQSNYSCLVLFKHTRDPIYPCYQDTCTAGAFFHNIVKIEGENFWQNLVQILVWETSSSYTVWHKHLRISSEYEFAYKSRSYFKECKFFAFFVLSEDTLEVC